jgi:hypothetical protein
MDGAKASGGPIIVVGGGIMVIGLALMPILKIFDKVNNG